MSESEIKGFDIPDDIDPQEISTKEPIPIQRHIQATKIATPEPIVFVAKRRFFLLRFVIFCLLGYGIGVTAAYLIISGKIELDKEKTLIILQQLKDLGAYVSQYIK